jgi:hypothetical protein
MEVPKTRLENEVLYDFFLDMLFCCLPVSNRTDRHTVKALNRPQQDTLKLSAHSTYRNVPTV